MPSASNAPGNFPQWPILCLYNRDEKCAHLQAVGFQAAGLLEGARRLRVVHHLEVGAAHLAPHPPCSKATAASLSHCRAEERRSSKIHLEVGVPQLAPHPPCSVAPTRHIVIKSMMQQAWVMEWTITFDQTAVDRATRGQLRVWAALMQSRPTSSATARANPWTTWSSPRLEKEADA